MEDRLHILMYRAFHGQRAMLRPVREALGLGPGQPKILLFLHADGPASQRAIADYFHIDPGTVSRMMEPLLRNGFITQTQSPDDRRVNLIELTEKGRQAAEGWDGACRKAESLMLSGFSDDEVKAFIGVLSRALLPRPSSCSEPIEP